MREKIKMIFFLLEKVFYDTERIIH